MPIIKAAPSKFFYLICIAILERGSFYGVRGVLLLYLTKSFMQESPAVAFEIAGLMFSLSMCISLLIGALNDRLQHLGQMLVTGLFFVLVGTILLMFHNPHWFLFSIACISLGNGAVRATLPTLFANVQDKSRSELYTYLYVANNVGALLGTGVCGMIGEVFGWNWGFALSSSLLVVGNLYVLHKEYQQVHNFFSHFWKIWVLLLPALALLWFLLNHRELALAVVFSSFIFGVCVGGAIHVRNGTGKDFTYLLMLLFLLILFSVFYEQGGLSMVLFTDTLVNRSLSPGFSHFLGITEIPVTLFSNVDSISNIGVGLFLAYLYKNWRASDNRSSYLFKFILAFGFALLNFVILTRFLHGNVLLPAWLVVLYYFLFVCGEQLAYPVGMAASVTLSPEKNRSFFVGLYMTAAAAGSLLAAEVSKWMHPPLGTPLSTSIVLYQGHAQHAVYFLSGVICLLLMGRVAVSRKSSRSKGL